MIYHKIKFNDTAIITKSELISKIGKWRVYKAKFLKKEVILVLDHDIKKKYKALGRVTDYKFIGLEKYESLPISK